MLLPFAAIAQRIQILEAPPSGAPAALRSIGEISLAQRIAVPEAGSHVLVLSSDGRVHTWNALSADQGWKPVDALTEVTAIAAGALHNAAVRADGTVWTWGANDQGQLGNGTLEPRPGVAAVDTLTDVRAIAAGKAFTLALRGDGTVWVWGSNWNDIDRADSRRVIDRPVSIPGLGGIEAIAVFRNRGYARDRAGRILEWGEGAISNGAAEPHEIDALADPELAREVSRRLDGRPALGPAVWFDNFGLTRRLDIGYGNIGDLPLGGTLVDAASGWTVGVIANPLGAAAAAEPGAAIGTSAGKAGTEAGRGLWAMIEPRSSSSSPNLSSAQFHNLFLQQAGTVCGWGQNTDGQLGDGTAVNRLSPVTADSLAGITMVSAGWAHGVALKNDGTVWTWGSNSNGQLGDATIASKPSPNPAPGLTGVIAVAAGGFHSMALKGDGTVWTWGLGTDGQLGNGSMGQVSTPVQVTGLANVVAIAAGERFSLALRSDGSVAAWGLNASGQLGDGSVVKKTTPVTVTGLTGVAQIAAGSDHALARKSDGSVWAWGFNGFGQLGDNSQTNRMTPVQSGSLTGVSAIGAGSFHSLAVQGAGTVWTWGQNSSGQLGDGTVTPRLVPVTVPGIASITAVAGGAGHSAALRSDGALFAWGNNTNGALGDGTTSGTASPVAVAACAAASAGGSTPSGRSRRLAAAGNYGLVIRTDGVVLGWGENNSGQLGDGSTMNKTTPVVVQGVAGASQISAGTTHGLAVKSDGTVRAWGGNTSGQLGTGNLGASLTSVQIPGLADVSTVAAGGSHSLASKTDGSVVAWGDNSLGQLGDGTNVQRLTPTAVPGITDVVAVAAGENHSLALKNDGTVWAWGLNSNAQLGDHTFTNRNVPVEVKGLTNVVRIAAGQNHSMALRSDGTVWLWGNNANGQLGDGSTETRSDRVRASDLIAVVAIDAAGSHSLAVKSDGTVWAWGLNSSGQLGNGTPTQSTVPVNAPGVPNAVAVAGGLAHSIALVSTEGVWAWGSNSVGQFGKADPVSSLLPIAGHQLPLCTYFIFPGGATVADIGAALSAQVSTAAACTWTASSSVPWITVTSGLVGGPGSFNYVVGPNPTTSSRTGTILVADKTFTVIQSAGTGCTYSISPQNLNVTAAGGTAQVTVTTGPGCSWNASAVDFWITLTSGATGTGSGAVSFLYDSNTSTIARAATIVIAGNSFVLTQDGTSGGGGGGFSFPTVGDVTPPSGTNNTQTFSFSFNDPDGAADLGVLNILINNGIDGRTACYMAYVPATTATGTLFLVNDTGDAGGPFAGSLSLPGAGSAGNSQCTISGGTVSSTGGTTTLTLNLSFSTVLAGNRIVFLAARDKSNNNSGWHAKGVWKIPGAAVGAAQVLSLNPARVTANPITVSAVFSDINGATTLDVVNLLINDAIDGRNACYIAYSRSTQTLFLVNDAGAAGGPFAGSVQIPSTGTVANSQCTINAFGSSVLLSGNNLTLVLNITFGGTFFGDRVVYAAARDGFGANSGWQPMGTITVQ
ncbi:MAG: BACON domain-containing carbohydrate-binding protein [Bryobacteraceae bacterium]